MVINTAGVATPAAAVAGGIAALVAGGAAVSGFITFLASQIDSNRSPDNLFIKINNVKKWPSGKKQDVKGGGTVSPNIDCGISGGFSDIQLMEYDWGSGDDNLGILRVPENHPKGVFTYPLDNKKEDSAYLLEITVL
jgi:hypothetical protein